jgi:hypothetical protein
MYSKPVIIVVEKIEAKAMRKGSGWQQDVE